MVSGYTTAPFLMRMFWWYIGLDALDSRQQCDGVPLGPIPTKSQKETFGVTSTLTFSMSSSFILFFVFLLFFLKIKNQCMQRLNEVKELKNFFFVPCAHQPPKAFAVRSRPDANQATSEQQTYNILLRHFCSHLKGFIPVLLQVINFLWQPEFRLASKGYLASLLTRRCNFHVSDIFS